MSVAAECSSKPLKIATRYLAPEDFGKSDVAPLRLTEGLYELLKTKPIQSITHKPSST